MGNLTKVAMVMVLVLVVIVLMNTSSAPVASPDAPEGGAITASAPEPSTSRAGSPARRGSSERATDRTRRSTPSLPPGGRRGVSAPTGERPSATGRSGATERSAARDPGGSVSSAPARSPVPGRSGPPQGTEVTSPGAGSSAVAGAVEPRPTPTGTGVTASPAGSELAGLSPSPTGVGTPLPSATAEGEGRPVRTSRVILRPDATGASAAATPPSPAAGTTAAPVSTPPVAASAPAPVKGYPKKHTIADGDSLWMLADEHYGRGTLYTYILEKNPQLLGDGSSLRVGDVITLPPPPPTAARSTAASRSGSGAPAAAPGFRSYTIVDGDTLYDIAEALLDNGLRWAEIEKANPGLDPGRLKVGRQILVPLK